MGRLIVVGLLISLMLAILLSPFASKLPDGLERVAENFGFIHKEKEAELIKGAIPDYSMPGIGNENIAASLAGIVGVIMASGLALALGMVLKKKK